MKKLIALALIGMIFIAAGCAPSRSAGLMEVEPVGKDPTLVGTAKVNLINDTGRTLYFRMLDAYTNVAISSDMQLDPKQSRMINPNSGQQYVYMIFTNNNDKDPIYVCKNAWFNAGLTYSLHFSNAVMGKK